ncbi:MAG: putative metalloprotease CJM1_0395 family protein [Desulfobacteraceae bacterium]|jgi:hypothetical protein
MIGSVSVSTFAYSHCSRQGQCISGNKEAKSEAVKEQTEQSLKKDAFSSGSPEELTEEEKRQVRELKQRDSEVRAHEAAHMAAGGIYVRGGASFTYQTGPDNGRYAVGGEVSIDTAPVNGDPEATIRKMQTVRSAALAPSNPSGQDRSVAAKASAREAQAQQELAEERAEKVKENREKHSTVASEYKKTDTPSTESTRQIIDLAV